MGRIGCLWATVVAMAVMMTPANKAAAGPTTVIEAAVDLDDDDGDGVADGRQLSAVPASDLDLLEGVGSAGQLRGTSTPGAVRLLIDGSPAKLGVSIPPAGRVQLQALKPGRHVIDLGTSRIEVRARQIMAFDGSNRPVDFTSSHASFQRTPPNRLAEVSERTNDLDALRYVVIGNPNDVPDHVRILSRSEKGDRIDELRRAKLVDVPCPQNVAAGLTCRSTWPIRVVADEIDQGHPLVVDRSIRAELGGGLTIHAGPVAQQIRVGGPRYTKHGPIRRLRAHMRLTVLRTWRQGAASLESRDSAAIERAKEQLAGATSMWQQCGVSFGDPNRADVRVVDPPPPYLVAVGCDLGLPSSGGRIRLMVEGRDVSIEFAAGLTPAQVARKLARAMKDLNLNLRVVRSAAARIGPGSFPVVDVMVHGPGNRAVRMSVPGGGPASTDPTLPVCIGRVDLAQGVKHFVDVDSMAGTVQERSLLKWIDDRDPGTLDGVIIPAFVGGGRIGESFIGDDRSNLRNLVLVDRAGVAASNASHTLAHEMGHVLLNVPGHPDDYGVDQPTLLMDSDAANPSAFGPRRLTIGECERALRQSGAKSAVGILSAWPFEALPK